MLTNSRDIKRRLEKEGWVLERIAGSHHVFKHPESTETIVLPHQKRTWVPVWSAPFIIERRIGNKTEVPMPHYAAIAEDAGPDKAVGIWFPDLPGCFSAGDDIDEAMHNAQEALALYAESQAREGHELPAPRTVSALKNDPEVAADMREYTVALIAVPAAAHAAE
jgi:predicted RNase H-like HicB family nuclease/predicted RNA binding protein YcfA (HicA-like mRNA interferase family)